MFVCVWVFLSARNPQEKKKVELFNGNGDAPSTYVVAADARNAANVSESCERRMEFIQSIDYQEDD